MVPTEVVTLSSWVFAIWWALILGVHIVIGVYNGLYAYCYWELHDTYLNTYLSSFQIGMPQPYHNTIAIVHATMSALHAACILLMLCGSLWQRSLAFTPWSSCTAGVHHEMEKSSRTSSIVVQNFSKAFDAISDRQGICGVNGSHFHAILILREIVETALQTVQAYRMSVLLPRTLLNRFYVLSLVTNCWSSVIAYSVLFKSDEARRRFTCIVLDCLLDLLACMGVELMILLSYSDDYIPEIRGFWDFTWKNDEWAARALNEFRMVVVVSWSDLASRAIFSVGLVMTTTNMKELLQRLPRNRSCVAQATVPGMNVQTQAYKLNVVAPALDPQLSKGNFLQKNGDSYRDTKLRTRCGRLMLRTIHLLFGAWGLAVLGFHIHASVQPTLPQCFMQVRPWAVSRPSCYLAGLDCHILGISGTLEEVQQKWSEFDSSTVVQLLIRHCPALEVPSVLSEFNGLHGLKVYNSTITNWGESAAFTNTNHPEMTSLYVVRTNMTDGLLPAGFQSSDFPQNLYDIEFCVTNLRELPDDLVPKWHTRSIIQVEYSQLTAVPSVLLQLEPYYLALTGNPITELPPEIFEVESIVNLGISLMNLQELPRNVTRVSSGLSMIFIGDTDISFFWSWVDKLMTRVGFPVLWVAPGSTYCTDLEMIQNGSSDAFGVPLSPEYSQMLMDPKNQQVIMNAVYCGPFDETFYSLVVDDYHLAITTPPSLVTF